MQILVLGMHRSGTSMVARLLNMMGAYFAPEGSSTGANQENPKGFWERRDVRNLNDMLLHSAGADWHRLSDFRLEKIPAATLTQFKTEAEKIILAMDAHRPWFLKEPRFCLLAPLWLDQLEFPACVIVYRSPIEVARSLEMRNGFSIGVGLALWERYNLAALNATRGKRRIQINHADLMADPLGAVQRLRKDLEALNVRGLREPSNEEILAFIDPSLYRAKQEQVRGRLSPAQRKLWKAFQNGRVLLGQKALRFSAESQEVLSQHDRWLEAQQKIAELSAEKERLQGEIEKRLSDLTNLTTKAEDQRRAAQDQQKALNEQLAMIKERDERIKGLHGQRKALEEKLDAQLASIKERDQRIIALEAKENAQAASLRDIERRIRQETHQRAQLDETLRNSLKYVTKLGKWSDRLLQEYQRVLNSNRWRIGCWLSFKPAHGKSKEVQRLAKLIASRPRQQSPSGDAARAKSSKETRPPPLQFRNLRQEPEPLEKLRTYARLAEATSFRKAASAKHSLPLPLIPSLENSTVCCIVLHRSGEHHLRNLFSSFLRVNTLNSVEFRVVLHACTDKSREVLGSFQDRLRIEVIDSGENHSFAYSNNRAAETTDAEYLVFLNNDIVFQENVLPELLRCLQAPRVALAGLRLSFSLEDSKHSDALQHAGIKFRSDAKHFFYRPFNLGLEAFVAETPPVLEEFPAVTAAMVACRRDLFLTAGGFCEKYSYGYEDVDLCLNFRRLLRLKCVSANYIFCIHDEGASRRLIDSGELRQQRSNNIIELVRRHGWYLRRQILADKMSGKLFFSDQPLTVAFAVTDSSPTTAAGDFFTASELAEACRQEFGWKTRYLSRQADWYDLTGVDVLVTLLDCYEISKVRHANPDLIKVAWMRNWFDRWASRPDFDQYDLYLCSSVKSAEWLRKTHRKPAWVFPLATNADKFARGRPRLSLRSDYCFTGSYWQAEREIETALKPNEIKGAEFAVFGVGWESHCHLGAYAKGFRPYTEMPDVYASTRVVVDDANSVTKEWGSVNSRVFDALAAGALVVTNGKLGAVEFFDRQLPSYGSPDELQSLLQHYLYNEEERQHLVAKLRERVVSRHTYRHRARTLKRILIDRARRGYRIAFKIGAPNLREAPHWGDYHFARSLGRCFAGKGHSFRIDCLDEWERLEAFGDDVVIVLRGLSRYRPKPGQINLMWNISHPDKIEEQEYEEFDHVFVASGIYAAELASRLPISVSTLLQCTDPEIFFPDPNPSVREEKLLFVGNSRKQYREIVRLAIEANLPLGVYGTNWPIFIPEKYIRAEYIDNKVLRQYYSRCDILLNDHWPSMREHGFLSNRLFDGAAAGAFLISDAVPGVTEIFGDDLVTYKGASDFREQVDYYLNHPEERRARAMRLRARVLAGHTFEHRAGVLLARIKELDKQKRGIEELAFVPKPELTPKSSFGQRGEIQK
jgi:spore maturation protein CgeB/GT2 family glycosyltransferase